MSSGLRLIFLRIGLMKETIDEAAELEFEAQTDIELEKVGPTLRFLDQLDRIDSYVQTSSWLFATLTDGPLPL